VSQNDGVIDELNPPAAFIATQLCRECPQAVLTSGGRGVDAQAQAMAADIVASGNPQWVAAAYRKPLCVAAQACQDFIDANPGADEATLAAGLAGVLGGFSAAQLRMLSWHLTTAGDGSDAFDARPDPTILPSLQALVSANRRAGGDAELLTQEGGLPRYHVQVSVDPELTPPDGPIGPPTVAI
jgi:hypothetical protein